MASRGRTSTAYGKKEVVPVTREEIHRVDGGMSRQAHSFPVCGGHAAFRRRTQPPPALPHQGRASTKHTFPLATNPRSFGQPAGGEKETRRSLPAARRSRRGH
jgi:hypothetical protein